MSIVCSGSVAFDYLMKFPGYFKDHILPEHLDSISLSFLVDEMTRLPGGVAPNICYSLALLGETPYLFAAVGEDFESYGRWLEARGIDCTFARVIPGKLTASFFANTDLSNAQIASFYTGAMANSADIKISELKDAGINTDLFIVAPSDPDAMIGYVRQCKAEGIPFAFDPSQQIVRMDKDMIREGISGAKFLFCNDYEYELLKKHGEMTHEEVLSNVYCLVVTQGKKGTKIYTEGMEYDIPIFPEERALDPTGVGDAFRSGFLKGYYKGLCMDTCGRMGALASTYVLEQNGTQKHHYTIDEFISRYRTVWDDGGALDAIRGQ